jgi:hypothetical protein
MHVQILRFVLLEHCHDASQRVYGGDFDFQQLATWAGP